MSDFNGRIREIAHVFETSKGDMGEIRFVIRRVLRAERKDGWDEGYSDGQEDHYYGTEAKLKAAEAHTDYEWTGTDPDGDTKIGGFHLTAIALAAVVEDRYDCGWRKLVISLPSGEMVAGIGADPDEPGGLMWWAGETHGR